MSSEKYYIYNRKFELSPQVLALSTGGSCHSFTILNAGTERVHDNTVRKDRSLKAQHRHPVYHIVLYTEGESEFLMNDKSVKFRPGTLALTSPWEKHSFAPMVRGVVYKCFSFHLDKIGDGQSLGIPFHELLLLYSGVKIGSKVFPVELTRRQTLKLSELIENIAEFLTEETMTSIFSGALTILNIFDFLINEIFLEKKDLSFENMSPLEKAKKRIEKDFTEKLDVSKLAAESGFSESHFIRAFKKRFKTPPLDYQIELKLKAAETYLSSTELPVKEIAFRTGFGDIYYFSKMFRKRIGVPPAEYRKRCFSGTK